MTIWFGASPRSRKVREIEKDNRVTLAFEHAQEGAYVPLLGPAWIEKDLNQRRRFWQEEFSTFWPVGPDGDDYVLIRFVPSRIELMNIQRDVTPESYGLQLAVLVRVGESWVVEEREVV